MEDESFFLENYPQCIEEAARFLRKKIHETGKQFTPVIALTLGSGFNEIAEDARAFLELPYNEIPYFPRPTVAGHEGKMLFGTLYEAPAIVFAGRKHYYELADKRSALKQVVFPVHVAASLGAKVYLATCAAGGLRPSLAVGDIMPIASHINYGLPSPLSGPQPAFPSLHDLYDKGLRQKFAQILAKHQPAVQEGVYLGHSGPSYETTAEIKLYRDVFKADAAGMGSIIGEAIAAKSRGMRVVALSLITNVVGADGINDATHVEVIGVLQRKEVKEKIKKYIKEFFGLMKITKTS